jgi:hypothetical protein
MSEPDILYAPAPQPLSLYAQRKLYGKLPVKSEVTGGPGTISWSDVGKGLTAAIATAVFPMIEGVLANHSWAIDWNNVGQTALNVALVYLGIKVFAPIQQITTFKKPSKIK